MGWSKRLDGRQAGGSRDWPWRGLSSDTWVVERNRTRTEKGDDKRKLRSIFPFGSCFKDYTSTLTSPFLAHQRIKIRVESPRDPFWLDLISFLQSSSFSFLLSHLTLFGTLRISDGLTLHYAPPQHRSVLLPWCFYGSLPPTPCCE